MALALITPPALDCVSLTEAKAHARVDDDDEDYLITLLVAAAVAHLDGRAGLLGRALAPQGWSWSGAIPDAGRLVLPLAPVLSIDAVTVAGEAVPSADFRVVDADNGEVDFAAAHRGRAATVSFTAGYEDALIPAPIRQAILLLIGHWIQHREEFTEVETSARSIPYGVRALISPYRRTWP